MSRKERNANRGAGRWETGAHTRASIVDGVLKQVKVFWLWRWRSSEYIFLVFLGLVEQRASSHVGKRNAKHGQNNWRNDKKCFDGK